ncbi:SMI1/KNR4 family protein [Undibacterium sp.]|uniref:SMI1/KNR4 family protein n=1 Tax=Undibacterium sp. TaxID=1914977 RepID=UPI00272FF7C0|nr:SMI1/KNR4 family protein [Undibacterium sp.]MDP1978674.1 SMI1/KNR4 family protein [Undibacterium sp.]
MSQYSDLSHLLSTGALLGKLKPVDPMRIQESQQVHEKLPSDYVDFLTSIGAGTIGDSQYSLYSGLIDPDFIYGDDRQQVENILFFGDDFQGFNAGFKTDEAWCIVEVNPLDLEVSIVAPDFQTFIREIIAQL